ncbi:hypothetical protein [Agrobacterium pusense]|uniref:hypothetical protein n=1 Tax=Agrobacterium pusense TaxID=648995 RepID=UPI000514561E|nr:hypothetical protein [Agrobacterium pusense]ANV24788.1 hypothetical protein BA939_13130 [Rhizobium sp. S41]KGE82700.1 hypothetical protein LW14_09365 [Rhizobium sp. H41]QWW74480.1 hypothetical protein KP800_03000 [Agrobacterium pusense]
MIAIIPRIEQLDAARTHEERAAWLLTCPLDVLLSCEMTIRNRLLNARFREGLEYLEIELTDLRRERGADGDKSLRMEVGAARGRMERIALGLPAARY